MEDKFQLDPVAAKLVRDGVITVQVVFTQSGADYWARSVQGHPRLGIYPHDSLVIGDLAERFAKHQSLHEFRKKEDPRETTSSHAVVSHRGNSILKNKSFGLPLIPQKGKGAGLQIQLQEAMENLSIEQASEHIAVHGVGTITKKGCVNTLPVDSLTGFDLKHPNSFDLFARMVAIANKLGNAVVLGRVTTQKELNIPGVGDLASWWASADCSQRLRVLSSQKKLNISRLTVGEHPLLSEVVVLPCPFRGDPEDLVAESDEEYNIFSDDVES